MILNSPVDRSSLLTAPPRYPVFWMRPAAAPALADFPAIVAQPGATAQAIAAEVAVRAARFQQSGEPAVIDLRFMKSMPEERKTLAKLLGEGEVSVVMECLGRTEIRETAVPCVWLTRHCNGAGETVGELIEITEVPDEIRGDREAVTQGIEALHGRLAFFQTQGSQPGSEEWKPF